MLTPRHPIPRSWEGWVATAGGVGCFSSVPGTLGSGVAFLVATIYPARHLPLFALLIVAVTLLGTWAADRYARRKGETDPSEVVIDEVAGMWIAQFGLEPSLALGSFLVFRILDIVKPFPIRQAEALPGGVGIMADDLLAGIATNAILRFFSWFFLAGGMATLLE